MESTLQRPHLAAQVLQSEAVPENHKLINIPWLLGPERLLLNSFPLLPPRGPQATYSPRTHARILEPPARGTEHRADRQAGHSTRQSVRPQSSTKHLLLRQVPSEIRGDVPGRLGQWRSLSGGRAQGSSASNVMKERGGKWFGDQE